MIKNALRRLSARISNYPASIQSSQSRLFASAWKALDLDAATWAVRRVNWLRDTARDHGRLRLEPERPQPMLGRPDALRVQRAYAPAVASAQYASDDIWGSLRDTYLAIVPGALTDPGPEAIGHLASRIFRTSAVNGFSYGTTFDRWPHRWNYLPLMIELSVVTLAEALGVVRLENPEQGSIASWREQTNSEELIEALERQLGFRIEHPRAGDPRGIIFGGRFLTRETCSQIYTAYRIAEAIERSSLSGPLNVVEIGGGYGGLAFWLRTLLGPRLGRQAVVDLPEVSAIQAMFLIQTLEAGATLPGETPREEKIQLVLNTALEEITFKPDLIINQDSMPEMPLAVVDGYLEWIANSGASLFASFNHEANAPNSPREAQGWISHMAGGRPEFTRLSRELSWDRPGYIEEIYRIAAIPGQGAGPV